MNSLKDIETISKRVYGPPEYIGNFPQTTSYGDDLPLDMSMKRRSPSPCQQASSTNDDNELYQPTPSSCNTPLRQHLSIINLPIRSTLIQPESPGVLRVVYDESESVRERPSVITCASSRYLHDYSLSSEDNHSSFPPPPSYSIATAHLRDNNQISLTKNHSSLEIKKESLSIHSFPHTENSSADRKGSNKNSAKRQLVQESPVDPEIDEHFRRSLGTHYQQLFVSPSPEEDSDSNDSVDEHFTKALGETWRKFKSTKLEHRPDIKSPEVNNSFRSQTPPNASFKGTADVSITRVPVTNSTAHRS